MMNKMMVIASMMISAFLFNSGISLKSQAGALKAQRARISQENDTMTQELKQKEHVEKKPPVEINKAFNLFINRMRLFENDDGIKMELHWGTPGEREGLEDHLVSSIFRNVKKLPVVLRINKFAKEIQVACVLNDIYILEKQTDFKVNEIIDENDVLEVKGELYGI